MSEPSPGDVGGLFDVTLPPNPYPGLRPFEKHEWPIFFGRERMADAVVADIVDKKMLVVHGDSGCGKSSLVRAAVLPRLEQENARGGIQWRTCSTTPGEAPLWNLSRDLARLVSNSDDDDLALEVRRVMNFGRSAPAALAELLQARGDRQICLLIDQFEELFDHSRHHGPEEAGLLTTFCTALFREPPDGLNVILTMRSEFLGACARFDDFALTVNATQYLLPRMQHEDLLRAIREPARLYDGDVSRPLAERLMADAGGGQDELPLIQHGLMLLHREHGSGGGPWRLGLEHYGERGLKALLSDHADAVMTDATRALPPASSRLVEYLLRTLTDINADGQAIRRPRTLRQLIAATGAAEADVRQVLDAFRAEGVSFLRPYGSDTIELDDRVDISHEALIRRWSRIADPKDGWLIREFRNGLVWRALLVQSDSFERDPANVLGPTTTDERQAWLQRRTAAWSERYGGGWDRVTKLVAASAAARDRQRQEEAKAQEAHARLQRLRLQFAYAALAVMVLVVFGFWSLWTEASRARDEQAELKASARQSAEDAQRSEEEYRRSEEELKRAILQLQGVETLRQVEAVAKTLETSDGKPSVASVRSPRVYLHITDPQFRGAAAEFERALESTPLDGETVAVPGIELVKSARTNSVLRCFHRDECQGEARKVVELANSLLAYPQLELQDLSATYESKGVRPRHYEIWFIGPLALRTATKQQSQ